MQTFQARTKISRRNLVKGVAICLGTVLLCPWEILRLQGTEPAMTEIEGESTLEHSGNLFLSFQVHAVDIHFDLDLARDAFKIISDLNGNSVRTEISWFDIEPVMGQWDERKIEWYASYFREAVHSFALTPIPTLYGIPNWAIKLYKSDRGGFLEKWQNYCAKASSIVNKNGCYVQVWNEPNNPVYALLKRDDFPDIFSIARKTLMQMQGSVEVILNVAANLPNWEEFVSFLLEEERDTLDFVGIDHYPGTYSLSNARDWQVLNRLFERISDPNNSWYGKKPAILETGYSTYMPFFKSEIDQRNWINNAFPEIRRINNKWFNRNGQALRIIVWYKLLNDHAEEWLNPEAHFGVLRILKPGLPFVHKAGYDALRQQFRSLAQ